MIDDAYFIDKKGKKIFSEEAWSHAILAEILFEKYKSLQTEYEKSGEYSRVDFLIKCKGYLKVSNIGKIYRVVTYSSSNVSRKQKNILEEFKKRGYLLDDVDITRNDDIKTR